MYRVLARNGLCLPANYTAAMRQAAGVRREAFICPPARRNRLWRADFSEYETAAGGRWNLGGVVDYGAKVNLACAVTVRKTTSDAISVPQTPKTSQLLDMGQVWALSQTYWFEIWSTIRSVPRRELSRAQNGVKSSRRLAILSGGSGWPTPMASPRRPGK